MIPVVIQRIFLNLTSQALSPTLYKLAHMIFPTNMSTMSMATASVEISDSGWWHCNCELNLHADLYQRWKHSVGSHLLQRGGHNWTVYGVEPGAPGGCATALGHRDSPCIFIHFQYDVHIVLFCCSHELAWWACQILHLSPNDHAGEGLNCHTG